MPSGDVYRFRYLVGCVPTGLFDAIPEEACRIWRVALVMNVFEDIEIHIKENHVRSLLLRQAVPKPLKYVTL